MGLSVSVGGHLSHEGWDQLSCCSVQKGVEPVMLGPAQALWFYRACFRQLLEVTWVADINTDPSSSRTLSSNLETQTSEIKMALVVALLLDTNKATGLVLIQGFSVTFGGNRDLKLQHSPQLW